MPVYNAESFIHKSVNSVLVQEYKNVELLLVNDGSTDRSEKLCNDYAIRDHRIRVISQLNSGPAAARNTGLYHATGEYIFFLDADDYILPSTVGTLVAAYNKHDPDLVICNFAKQVTAGPPITQRVSFSPENSPFNEQMKLLSASEVVAFVGHFLKYPSNHLISYCWARLYKTAYFKEFGISSHEDMRLFEDYVLNLDYMSRISTVVFVNEPLYVYVMHESHASASMAILNTESLLHDMSLFREKTREFLQQNMKGSTSTPDIEKEIGHALIHYVIIFLVRSCRRLTNLNKQALSEEIGKLIRAPIVRESLRQYTPTKGSSRLVPLLMRVGAVEILMLLCRYKANKRYGRL